jgi:putative ABC transport system substrate-binding protein
VIVAGAELPLRALQAATRTIPLVGMSDDMVAEGLVTSLARPGGNITGISLLSPELDGKRQDLLIEAVPGARRIAAMADSRATPTYHLQVLQHGARSRARRQACRHSCGTTGSLRAGHQSEGREGHRA